jgi:hypothetical protein
MMLIKYHHDVRTTLTLDDDVARMLEKETRRSGASFKETVNRALRLGLVAANQPIRKPFVVTPRNVSLPAGIDCIEQLIEAIEDPSHS